MKRTFNYLWKTATFITVYAGLVYYLYHSYHIEELAIPMAVPAVLATAISLILGFRTNSAYDRWWEARKIWGAIINDSRTLVRQSISFLKEDAAIQSIAYKQIAWCYSLANSLRGLSYPENAKKYLDQDEIEFVASQDNIPNAILQLLENEMKGVHDQGKIKDVELLAMDHTFRGICNSMGMCERIKKTVFPLHYSVTSKLTITIFTLILPFGLIGSIGFMSIPVTFIVTVFFLMIDITARYLQDPFENRSSDIPLTNLCRTIEINLLQMIGTKEIPEKTVPDNMGVLM